MNAAETLLYEDEGYGQACWASGIRAYDKARYYLAIGLFDAAQRIYEHLVHVRGRTELANDLAGALMNKGNALSDVGQLREAIASYDAAIAIRTRLVETEGRTELANDLAGALMNKALGFEKLQDWQNALLCYDQAIRWREACVAAGMSHVLPDLLQTIRYRLMTFVDLQQWEATAADVISFISHLDPVPELASLPERLLREIDALRRYLHTLAREDRDRLYAALGGHARILSTWLEP